MMFAYIEISSERKLHPAYALRHARAYSVHIQIITFKFE